ncbi:YaaA family protein [Aquihabitans daechungensis]|uniref:YaaA family protein n=1 Tax=Aquihabitans daechungensis TaxID=1052257 RepID=UPI003BA06A7B
MARRSLILLPPSEGKAPEGDGLPWAPGTMAVAELDGRRAQVLRALGRGHAARLGPTRPAIERYTGVLYQGLDAASLRAVPRRRLDRSVLVVSGLWGLVAPPDPIPHYKLKMSANVAPLGKLSTWWRPAVTAAIADRAARALVWDLLPIEHSAAVSWSDVEPFQRVTVRFVDAQGKTVSHWNKLLKGSLVRWLVTTGATDIDALAGFEHPQGYQYDPGATVRDGRLVALTFRSQG